MDLKEIQERNYAATVRRGLINIFTDFNDFYLKIVEETEELNKSKLPFSPPDDFDSKELADIIIVCLCMAKHFNIDIEQILAEKTIFNENRK
jgi:NTP pyrophosphatase (non-canonical NTP hydrolase)